MKAKDDVINVLKQKEAELKSKDDFIATLNRNIEKLQYQLDARIVSPMHENPLLRDIDDLTAKNNELRV